MATDTPQTTVKAPALPYEMKATLKGYWARVGVWRFLLGFALTYFIYLRGGFWTWVICLVAIIVLISVILFLLSKRSIKATSEGLEYTSAFGAKYSIAYSEIDVARLFLAYIEAGGFGVIPRIIVTSKQGKPFASIYALYWPPEGMDALLAILKDKKVKVESFDTLVNSAGIAKQFPDAVRYYEKHPYLVAMGIVVVLLVVISVGVLLFM
jgi:hypothetical protein